MKRRLTAQQPHQVAKAVRLRGELQPQRLSDDAFHVGLVDHTELVEQVFGHYLASRLIRCEEGTGHELPTEISIVRIYGESNAGAILVMEVDTTTKLMFGVTDST